MLISNPVCEHRQRDLKGYNWECTVCVGTGNHSVLQCMLKRPFFQPISQIWSVFPTRYYLIFLYPTGFACFCLFLLFLCLSLSSLNHFCCTQIFFNSRTVLVWLLVIFYILQYGYSNLIKFLPSMYRMCKLCIVQTKEGSEVRRSAFTSTVNTQVDTL